jgi:hypothetical protein
MADLYHAAGETFSRTWACRRGLARERYNAAIG